MAWNRNPLLYATPRQVRERSPRTTTFKPNPTRQEIAAIKRRIMGGKLALASAQKAAAAADALVGGTPLTTGMANPPVNAPTIRAAAIRAASARAMGQHAEAHIDYQADALAHVDVSLQTAAKVAGFPDPPQRRSTP